MGLGLQPRWFESLGVLVILLVTCLQGVPSFCADGGTFDPHFENPLEEIPVHKMQVELESSINLTVTPTLLTWSGQWVSVSWSGVWLPTSYDWIAVYVGEGTDPTKTAPVKYKTAASDAYHLISGSGTVRFRLLNMRDVYKFAFVRKWGTDPSIAAVTHSISMDNVNEPTQVHLAMTGADEEMRVTWTTRDVGDDPHVKWGLASDQLLHRTDAMTTTYTRGDMCGGPAAAEGWLEPGVFHTAVMKGLKPGAIVFYQVGDRQNGFSKIFSFYPLPPVGPSTQVNLIAFGDMGQAELDGSNDMVDSQRDSLATIRRMLMDSTVADDTELQERGLVILHVGDLSYARGYACQWDVFFDQIQLIAARAPWMTCIGNHERDWPGSGSYLAGTGYDSGGECGVPYERRFPMPAPAFNFPPIRSTEARASQMPNRQARRLMSEQVTDLRSKRQRRPSVGDSPWYSFDHGPAHFVMMDTEHEFGGGSSQYEFLEQDLSSVNRSHTPWLIFSGHRPMYVDSTYDHIPDGDGPVATHLRIWVEPLLLRYKVDLALWGHHHSYQRTCPVFEEKCIASNPDGSNNAPIHLVVGMAGFALSTNIKPTPPEYIQTVNVVEHGYVRLSIAPKRLHFEFIGNNDGGVLDQGYISKPGAGGDTESDMPVAIL